MGDGYLEILNVGAGDIKITFDKDDPAELIRAGRIIRDMLRRGFALLIKQGDAWTRVERFDETTGEYIIADFAPGEYEERRTLKEEYDAAVPLPPKLPPLDIASDSEPIPVSEPNEPKKGNGRRTRWKDKRVKVGDAKVTAVGRSAGG